MSYAKQFIQEAFGKSTNLHSSHIEDLPVLAGKYGIRWTIDTLNSLLSDLASRGSPKKKLTSSIKIDGAPAAMCFISFPGLEGPGVATKGLFAKNPKYARTTEDCQSLYGHAPDLVRKMQKLLLSIPSMGIPEGEVWQGDFLYDSESLSTEMIGGEECLTFQPNTIIYAVPLDSALAGEIANSDIGIAFHTRYTGTIDSAKANYNAKVAVLNPTPGVFMTDPYIPSLAGKATFSPEETQYIDAKLSAAEETYNTLDIEDIINNEDFVMLFNTFQNTLVRKGTQVIDPQEFYTEFNTWLNSRVSKELDSKKTDKGKEQTKQKFVPYQLMAKDARIISIIKLINDLTDLKSKFIQKLNQFGQFKTYLKSLDGNIMTTNQEGFMISDEEGNAVKLVDRGEFSKMNFDPNILKGWQKPGEVSESVKNFLKEYLNEDVLPFIDIQQALDKNDISVRKAPPVVNPKKTYKATLEAPPGVARKKAAQKVHDDLPDSELKNTAARPVIDIVRNDVEIELHFKDAVGQTGRLDARSTDIMESWWTDFVYRTSEGLPLPTEAQVASTFHQLDSDWYFSFEEGARLIVQYLKSEDPAARFTFSREGKSFPDSAPPIHKIINDGFNRARAIFKDIGTKKDAWNPSDFYACRSGSENDVVNSWAELINNPESTLKDVNMFLKELAKSKTLVGISLKKLTESSSPDLEQTNLDDGHSKTYNLQLTKIELSFTNKSEGRTLSGGRLSFSDVDAGDNYFGTIRNFSAGTEESRYCSSVMMELSKVGGAANLGKVSAGVLIALATEYNVTFMKKVTATPKARKGQIPEAKEMDMLTYMWNLQNKIPEIIDQLEEIKAQFPSEFVNYSQEKAIKFYASFDKKLSSYEDKNHIAFNIRVIPFYLILARAKAIGELNKVLNALMKGAKKETETAAPFTKIS
jgi:hypothetical protein